jgi:hypothetical protein
LRAGADDVLGDGKSLETIDTDGWVDGESFVDAAAPVGKSSIIKRAKSRGRGNDVHRIVAIKVAADFEVAKVREGVNGCIIDTLIVAGKGEV